MVINLLHLRRTLACGYVAKGRMEEPITILTIIDDYFKENLNLQTFSLQGKSFDNCSPTIEKVDGKILYKSL